MSDDEIEFLGEVRDGSCRGKLSDRLLAISREELKECGEDQGIQSDSEPTEVEIINQERLPTKAQVETQRFKEPIMKWVPVSPSDRVPSWNRDLLPEEERVETDCDPPPPPPRVDISLVRFKQLLEKESVANSTNTNTSGSAVHAILSKESVLRGNFAEEEEVVVYDNHSVYRTTFGAIRRSSTEQETDEEEEEEEDEEEEELEENVKREEGAPYDRRRSRELRQRSRSVSSSPGRDISDWSGLETSGRTETPASREDQDQSRRRNRRDRREREDSRYSRDDRDSQGGRYQRFSSYDRTERDRGSHRRSMEDRYYSRSDRGERERGSSRHDRRTPTSYHLPHGFVGRHSGSSSSRNCQEYSEWRGDRDRRRR